MNDLAPAVVALQRLAGDATPRRRGDLSRVVLAIAASSLAEARGVGSGSLGSVHARLRSSPGTEGWPMVAQALCELHGRRLLDPTDALRRPPRDAVLADVLDALTPPRPEQHWLGDVLEALLAVEVARATEPTLLVRARSKAGHPGTDATVGLATLLAVKPAARLGHLGELGADVTARVEARVVSARHVEALADALAPLASPLAPLVVPRGARFVRAAPDRRRAGAHFTPPSLADELVARTLAPLLGDRPSSSQVLALTVCDPAMGTGAILLAACRFLAAALAAALEREGHAATETEVRRRIVEHCLVGVDREPLATELARLSLWLEIGDRGIQPDVADRTLHVADALVAPFAEDEPSRSGFSWRRLPDVSRRGGVDAVVGNPPWVSWAGRGAQPLDDRRRAHYAARYRAFAGFRSAQALFVERGASLLVPGGRLGLLLPSSMSEQHGYAPARRAHDRLAACDPSLPDVGDAFHGVFQPCMMLLSTRREVSVEPVDAPWPVERRDLDETDLGILEKLTGPPLPARLFGERGLQTSGDDRAHLRPTRDARHTAPLRSGSDVEGAMLKPPSTFADPEWFGPRLARGDWASVKLLVRQTARYPVVAASDGLAFRNSLLAGFADDEHPVAAMVAYLGSAPIRFRHWASHRDARQGIPQVKVAHLRGIPAPGGALVAELMRAASTTRIDELVGERFGLTDRERAHVAARLATIA